MPTAHRRVEMFRGAMTTSSAAPQDVLLSSVGKPLRLHVPYKSFDPPAYGAASETVVGRLWTYDAGVDLVVLETGAAPDLPTALHRAPAAIVYNSPYGRVNSTTSGFKLIRGTQIAGVEFLTEEEYHVHTNYVSELCTIPPVSLAAMEVRDAASVQKSLERILRIGPKAAGEVGQTVFDALSKTYVFSVR
ncbi:hypothetical protein MVES1_000780 [Malassezia vespertilionis]|uniref:uncharacterized protein n=1 Tax=Malassezia vespertilionis TaxID=2020962 RepID=UPI0024B053CA|nr:uncharacterized protein MVES1_000780 [Malassezia vespertilionis]WFD05450.1 hypothetical protein MVES1_000780 [Malassezia vespertilionis]